MTVQLPATMSQKTPWYLGRGATRLTFASPLTQDQVVERLREHKGTNISGGKPWNEWQVVAATNRKGFFVLFRRDLFTIRPLTASCRWIPAESGTAFQATIVPAMTGKAVSAAFLTFLFVTATATTLIVNLTNAPLFVGSVVVIGLIALGVILSGVIVPRRFGSQGMRDHKLVLQFLLETLNASPVGSEHRGSE
jgi:hypothetical protein